MKNNLLFSLIIFILCLLSLTNCAIQEYDEEITLNESQDSLLITTTELNQTGMGISISSVPTTNRDTSSTPSITNIINLSNLNEINSEDVIRISQVGGRLFNPLVLNYSPNGNWGYHMIAPGQILVISAVNPQIQQYFLLPESVENGRVDIYPYSLGWYPDSSGFVIGNVREGGGLLLTNPLWIINNVNGIFQPFLSINIPDPALFDGVEWSVSGDNLFTLFENSSQNNMRLIQINEYNRQFDLQGNFEIQIPAQYYLTNIFPFGEGFILIEQSANATYIDSFTISSNRIDQIVNISGEKVYYVCGLSPDLQYALLIAENGDSGLGLVDFLLVDVDSGRIEERYALRSPELSADMYVGEIYTTTACIHSEDGLYLGFPGENANSEPGLIFWDWEDLEFNFWSGDYEILGWNTNYHGFTVIEQNQNGTYDINVISVE